MGVSVSGTRVSIIEQDEKSTRGNVADEVPEEWLTERSVIVAAHPDDEAIGLGTLLGRTGGLQALVHVTDGAPRRERDVPWQEYAQVRRREVEAAMREAGVGAGVRRVCLPCPDQQASFRMAGLARMLCGMLRELGPEFVWTHPYEGGHPDHDATAFAVHAAVEMLRRGGEKGPTILEFSSYHRGPEGMETGRFLAGSEERIYEHRLNAEERAAKKKLFACYESQAHVLQYFSVAEEPVRRAPRYEFNKSPQEGGLYYENFRWGVTGAQWRALAREAASELGLAAG